MIRTCLPTNVYADVLVAVLFKFCICSRDENCASCATYSVFDSGSSGSWYFICVTRSIRKSSLSSAEPVFFSVSCEVSEMFTCPLLTGATKLIFPPFLQTALCCKIYSGTTPYRSSSGKRLFHGICRFFVFRLKIKAGSLAIALIELLLITGICLTTL